MTATRQPSATTPSVDQISPPQDARVLSTLTRIDYEDAFAVTADVQRTPEQWIRAVLQDAPASVRRRLWLGWTALGLKLGPPSSSHRVLGWKVEHSDPAFVLLAADSWLGLRGRLLFRSEPHGLLFATFVQLTNPAARALWAAVTPRHQHVVRSLLTHAVSRPSERTERAQ
jgi:Protein of unknown function (DUF2867)